MAQTLDRVTAAKYGIGAVIILSPEAQVVVDLNDAAVNCTDFSRSNLAHFSQTEEFRASDVSTSSTLGNGMLTLTYSFRRQGQTLLPSRTHASSTSSQSQRPPFPQHHPEPYLPSSPMVPKRKRVLPSAFSRWSIRLDSGSASSPQPRRCCAHQPCHAPSR